MWGNFNRIFRPESLNSSVLLVRGPLVLHGFLLLFTDLSPVKFQFPIEDSHQVSRHKLVLEGLLVDGLNDRTGHGPDMCSPESHEVKSEVNLSFLEILSSSGSSHPSVASMWESRKVSTSASAALIPAILVLTRPCRLPSLTSLNFGVWDTRSSKLKRGAGQ